MKYVWASDRVRSTTHQKTLVCFHVVRFYPLLFNHTEAYFMNLNFLKQLIHLLPLTDTVK